MPQFVCLKAIGQLEEQGRELITVAQIAKEVQLSPATVSRILERLVKAGSVTRVRSEQDRRKVSLCLPPAVSSATRRCRRRCRSASSSV